MKCPSCSAENKEGNRFCAMCGSNLQLTCPKCGAPSDPSLNFCGTCGAKLNKVGDGAPDQVHPPEAPVEAAEGWVSDFSAAGWGREAFWNSIRDELSKDLRPRDGEGIIFAGRSSLDLHLFLRRFDGSDIVPVAGFMGTNFRLIILTSKMGSRKLDPLLEIDYKELREVKELKEAEARKDRREVEGLLRVSLQGRNEPIDLVVLNTKARTPLLRFLQTASSAAIAAPADLQESTLQSMAVGGAAKKAQDAVRAARQEEAVARKISSKDTEEPLYARAQQSSGMKMAATILGIIGGIAGAIGAVAAMMIGGIASAFGAEAGGSVIALGVATLILAIVGTVGGAIAVPKPKIAGILMLISGIGGIIAVSAAYAFGGALLIVGGVLALLALRQPKSAEIRA